MKRYFIERESSYQERIHSLSIDKEMLLAKLNAAERISVQRRSISSENLENLASQNDVLRKELDMVGGNFILNLFVSWKINKSRDCYLRQELFRDVLGNVV